MKYIMKNSIILVAVFVSCFSGKAQINNYEKITSYIVNPSFVEENQLPPHVPYIPFETVDQAIDGEWGASKHHQSLNGTWKFFWTKSPLESPEEFHTIGFNDSEWGDISGF